MRVVVAMLTLISLLTSACARQGVPPGGPRDTSAPEVQSVSPESLAVDVDVDSPITIVFSEKIDPKTLEMALWVTPGGAIKPRIDVSGEKAVVQLGESLPESTTVGVLVTTVIKDPRREGQQNQMLHPYRWVFSTGNDVWPGVVEGKVKRVGDRASGQLLVGLYPGQGDSIPDPLVVAPLAITQADTSGRFRMEGLPADGNLRWLFGLFDRDGNREIRGRGEFVSASPESVVLAPGFPEAVVSLRLVDPEAPGDVQGTLAREAGDTTAVFLELYASEADSLAQPIRRGQAGKDGAFTLSQVPPGSYRLIAFCDNNSNNQRDEEEDAVSFGLVDVTPGDTRELGEWTGPRCVP